LKSPAKIKVKAAVKKPIKIKAKTPAKKANI